MPTLHTHFFFSFRFHTNMTEQSSIPSPNNKNNTPSTNKDLSCLRCRKKKAK